MHTPSGREATDDENLALKIAPNQGLMAPYQKTHIDFTFDPKSLAQSTGWNHEVRHSQWLVAEISSLLGEHVASL
jgi:hypothetical protein